MKKYIVITVVGLICAAVAVLSVPEREKIGCIRVYEKDFSGEKILTVPFESLIRKNGRDYVWIIRGDKAELSEVKTGKNINFETQILSGLSNGDTIVECPVWNDIGEKEIIK